MVHELYGVRFKKRYFMCFLEIHVNYCMFLNFNKLIYLFISFFSISGILSLKLCKLYTSYFSLVFFFLPINNLFTKYLFKTVPWNNNILINWYVNMCGRKKKWNSSQKGLFVICKLARLSLSFIRDLPYKTIALTYFIDFWNHVFQRGTYINVHKSLVGCCTLLVL